MVLTAGCSSGGLENIGLMTPEAADLAGPNLKAVCKQLGVPPVLNFGPCLAIGRLEIVATEIARELGVDLPQLPLVISAAQWLEEQALADGAFALALGLPLHLGVPPFITGSSLVTKVLTEDMTGLTGGRVIIVPVGRSARDKLGMYGSPPSGWRDRNLYFRFAGPQQPVPQPYLNGWQRRL